MKRKRFSVEQIVAVLKQAELGVGIELVSRVPGAYHPDSLYIFESSNDSL